MTTRKVPKNNKADLGKFFYSQNEGAYNVSNSPPAKIAPEEKVMEKDFNSSAYGVWSSSYSYGGVTGTPFNYCGATGPYIGGCTGPTGYAGYNPPEGAVKKSSTYYLHSTDYSLFVSVIAEEFSAADQKMTKYQFLSFLKRKICNSGSDKVKQMYISFIKANYPECAHIL